MQWETATPVGFPVRCLGSQESSLTCDCLLEALLSQTAHETYACRFVCRGPLDSGVWATTKGLDRRPCCWAHAHHRSCHTQTRLPHSPYFLARDQWYMIQGRMVMSR